MEHPRKKVLKLINVEDYIPLVNKITAKRYKQFSNKYLYEDLFQIGCLGLVTAAKRFNESKETKFLNYAYMWVDGYILRTIRDDRWFLSKNRKERFTTSTPFSLNKFTSEEENKTYLDLVADPENDLQYLELKIAMDKLPILLKQIIQLRYFNDLTQTNISKILGISQVKVSRYERKAIETLRKEMMA